MTARILVTALNWGLGHATRCIPVIHCLQKAGCEVVLGADGPAFELMDKELPDCEMVELPSYGIRYQTGNMVLNMTTQMPRILWAIRAEHREALRVVKTKKISGIISDNRYGCYAPTIPSILLTHQLYPITPFPVTTIIAQTAIKHALRRFSSVWVPDLPGAENFSGSLSHGSAKQTDVQFIGPLSRLTFRQVEYTYDVAVVLSGPEPQRTRLEQILLEQALALPYRFVFVLGKTHVNQHYFAADHVEVISYMTSVQLNLLLNASRMVVCRSGYSSIMDLAVLGKKALLVPTPGQTEQEYLSERFQKSGRFLTQRQEEINLGTGIEVVLGMVAPDPVPLNDRLKPILGEWLNQLPAER